MLGRVVAGTLALCLSGSLMPAAAERKPRSELVSLTEADGIALDLRYASSRNFVGRPVESDPDRVWLHLVAAKKLERAAALLASAHPGCRLLVLDGFRSGAAQRALWALVKGTQSQRFVANPDAGSIHEYGLAVDLTIADTTGRELDMGTPFDEFSPKAEPRLEGEMLARGALTATQVGNRQLLRRVMVAAGFTSLAVEWWHFDALPPAVVRARYSRIE